MGFSFELKKHLKRLFKTDHPEHSIKVMTEHQKEINPNISDELARDFVIEGVIREREDRKLDYLWHNERMTAYDLSKVA